MSLASPWPLKIVLDSVLDASRVPSSWHWLTGADAGPAGAAERRGDRDRRHRAAPGRQRVSDRLLHGQHRPVDRARPPPERVRAPAAAVDVVLRPPAGRPAHQHHHRRHQRRAGLRLDVAARSRHRHAHDRRHARGDVRAQLALHAGRARGHAAARAVRLSAARRREQGARTTCGGVRARSCRSSRKDSAPFASSRRSRRARSSGSGSTRRAAKASRRRCMRGACGRCSARWSRGWSRLAPRPCSGSARARCWPAR